MKPHHLVRALAALALAVPSVRGQGAAPAQQDTIITSDNLEMQNTGVEAYFVFSKNVRLVGTNLEVTCDKLEIFGDQKRAETGGVVGEVGSIRRILATGNVTIRQEGRRATAGRAEVLPGEDRIELTGEPVVSDPQGTVAGDRIVFFRGEQNARIDRPRVVLRALPNLGFPQAPAPEPAAPEPPAVTFPGAGG